MARQLLGVCFPLKLTPYGVNPISVSEISGIQHHVRATAAEHVRDRTQPRQEEVAAVGRLGFKLVKGTEYVVADPFFAQGAWKRSASKNESDTRSLKKRVQLAMPFAVSPDFSPNTRRTVNVPFGVWSLEFPSISPRVRAVFHAVAWAISRALSVSPRF